ncbi:hypothetical protein BGW36DRAFT_339963 [Talaromyces proteolyticus]|uniref:DUF7703 domain-containing protein n=1 Tax=Talaromyces proteolyticus TaxID=1131652 RepID=A0AAD4KT38_9EURO|nr:uncharacterized protein BGW36DRAFT_339963 [Talaromyces proteolyticus]KAH8698708.1 hypothetical protein BGW36DRAFT_339963 [Talaromyces proteolyticus]
MAKNITVPYVPIDEFSWSLNYAGSLPWNQTIWSLIAVFTAVPLWMTVEITIWIFYLFRRWSGLYFWSVLITTWGVTLHAIGFVLTVCVPSCNSILSMVIADIGWIGMVTGFAFVMYSRLNLISFVMRNRYILRLSLAMIIVDAIIFHFSTIIIFAIGVFHPSSGKFLPYMNIIERVQIMVFTIQEVILSTLYVYGTVKMAQESFNTHVRKTIVFLIVIQAVAILLDVLIITLDYADYYILKSFIHSFVYAVKLQLEFVILNEFREVISKLAPRMEILDMDEEHFRVVNTNKPSNGTKTNRLGE